MVGIVIVSHSENLAKGACELAKMMASEAPIVAAGGIEGGEFGTSYDRINQAVNDVLSPEGVLIFVDMGSAVMTAEMVIESRPADRLVIVDAPIVEGAIVAAVSSASGAGIEEILETLKEQEAFKKL